MKFQKRITREMRKGNAHNAMKLLTNNMKNGVLPLNKKTLEQLKQKHPQRRDADPEIMLPDKPEEIHPIKFHSIDAENVRKVALKTMGEARPYLMLTAGKGSLHRVSLGIVQMIYAKPSLR